MMVLLFSCFVIAVHASYSEGLRKYMLGVYNYMTLALAISGFTAFLLYGSFVFGEISNTKV